MESSEKAAFRGKQEIPQGLKPHIHSAGGFGMTEVKIIHFTKGNDFAMILI